MILERAKCFFFDTDVCLIQLTFPKLKEEIDFFGSLSQ